jgi:transcriptional regulator with XRE-family HTH domain
MRNYRRHLGPRFTEGGRLLWLVLEQRGVGVTAAATMLGCSTSSLTRALYGENVPGVDLLADVTRVFGVPIGAWAEKPTEAFIPPAAREAEPEPSEGAA